MPERTIIDQTLSLVKYLKDNNGVEDFKHFLSCPLHCEKPKIFIRLKEHLIAFLEDKKGKELNFDRLAYDVFRRKRYSDNMETLFPDFSDAIERFLAFQKFNQDAVQQSRYLCAQFSDATDTGLFQAALKNYAKAVEKLPEGRDKLYKTFQIKDLQWNHPDTNRHRKAPVLYLEAKQAYGDYDTAIRLLYECSKVTSAEFMNISLEERPLVISSQIFPKIYQDLLALCQNKSLKPDHLTNFFTQYDLCFKNMEEADKTAIRKLLINCCMIQIQQGQLGFVSLLSDVFKKIPPQKDLCDTEFINQAISIGLSGQLDAMKKFIDHPPELAYFKEQALATVHAYYHFYLGEAQEAMTFLPKFENKRPLRYKQRYHSLKIRILYRMAVEGTLPENMDIYQALDSYEKYFNRDTLLNQEAKKPYDQLHYFIGKMLVIVEKKALYLKPSEWGKFSVKVLAPKVDQLRTELEKEPLLFAKWIEEQLNALSPRSEEDDKKGVEKQLG